LDLTISPSLSAELSLLPSSQLTLKEFVCLQVHNSLSRLQSALDKTRDQLASTSALLQKTQDDSAASLRDEMRLRKVAEGREESLKLDLAESDRRLKEVEGKVRSLAREADELREKGRAYDEVLARAKNAEQKYDDIRRVAEDQAHALNSAADAEKKVIQKSLDGEQQLQLLRMDKAFLEKELAVANERAGRAERDYDGTMEQLRSAMEKRDALVAKLQEVQESGVVDFEERLRREVEAVRIDCRREVEESRSGGREAAERENRILRDAKADARRHAEKVERDLVELRNAHEMLVLRHAVVNTEKGGEELERASEIKRVRYENSKLEGSLEEAKKAIRDNQLQVEHFREKVGILQTEYVKLEQVGIAERKNLDEKLNAKNEQLEVYLKAEIEYEARIEEGEVPSTTPATAPLRRVQHSVELARKCVALEKERLRLVEEKDCLAASAKVLEDRVKRAEEDLARAEKPTKYVIQRLNQTEEENTELKKENHQVKEEMDELKKEMVEILEKRKVLEVAVEKVKMSGLDDIGSLGLSYGVGAGANVTVPSVENDLNDLSIHMMRAEDSPNRGEQLSYHSGKAS